VRYQTGIKRNEGVGLRLKKQYDLNEQGIITNIKRIYYTDIKNYDNLEILSENPYMPGAFTTTKYAQFVADQQVITVLPVVFQMEILFSTMKN
jgi:hypothetical protein